MHYSSLNNLIEGLKDHHHHQQVNLFEKVEEAQRRFWHQGKSIRRTINRQDASDTMDGNNLCFVLNVRQTHNHTMSWQNKWRFHVSSQKGQKTKATQTMPIQQQGLVPWLDLQTMKTDSLTLISDDFCGCNEKYS